MAQQELEAAIAELGLSIKSEFIPFSQSRNKNDKQPSLNWRVTLQRNGRDVLTTDYMAGSAHAPSYKQGDNSKMRAEAVRHACEDGYTVRMISGGGTVQTSKRIEPDAVDVIHSLVMDADVLDSGGFEEWASNFGYDTDSRKAENIYRACLEIALKLRNVIGEDGLAKLREAGQDY